MATNSINPWWAIDGFLAGTGVPYVDFSRRLNAGGDLNAFQDDLPLLHQAGIRAVVCLLNIPSDESVFHSAGFEFICIPINDGQPPTIQQAGDFIEFLDSCRLRNLPVAVFCEAGVGRTSTMIATYLIQKGKSAAEAIACLRTKEPSAVETKSQIGFLEEFEKQRCR